MDKGISEKQQTLKCRKSIITLLLLSLICTALNYSFIYEYDKEFNLELVINFPVLCEYIYLIFDLAPTVLLVIYILKYYNQRKANVLVPIIFGMISVGSLYYIIVNVLIYGYNDIIFTIKLLLTFVSFAFATVIALKGYAKKSLIIIPIAVGLLCSIYDSWNFVYYSLSESLYLFTSPLYYYIGTICLYVALLLFSLNNSIPTIIHASPKKEYGDPEQLLVRLKCRLDSGEITQEEYQSQRADIIKNL